MSGPWEKYAAQPEEAGPWAKYQSDGRQRGLERGKGLVERFTDFAKADIAAIPGRVGNLVAGGVRGAGSIGATLLAPVDAAARAVGIENDWIGRTDRRQAMDDGLRSMGADSDSAQYQVGKLGAEVAGTSGAGGALAGLLRGAVPSSVASMPVVNRLMQSVGSNGFSTGAPAASTIGGQVGNALTRGFGGAVAGGASAGLINPEDAAFGAAIGGGLPIGSAAVGMGSRAAGRALRGDAVSSEAQALAARAKELGITIPADRLVNSKPLNALSASLNYVPFSGRAATEEAMTTQLNRALSRTFGQDSPNVTLALRKADDALGTQFDDFLRSNTVRVDRTFIDDLADAANQATRELGTDGASIIGKQVDEILAKAAGGEIDGQAAYNIKRTLDRIGRRNSPEAWYALDLKQKLMSALDRSVGADKAAEFSGLRKQYGNMLELQKLATNGVDGEVSVARLANMKNIRNKEMQELADIAAQFVKPREGQHGAMQRAVAGLAAGSVGGLPVLAGTVAAGRGTNMLLNSDLARNAVLGTPNPAVENALAKLLPVTYRVAPTLSAQ